MTWEHVRCYDIFDESAMNEPYRTNVREPMEYLTRDMEKDGWQMVAINTEFSVWKRERISDTARDKTL